MIEDFLLKRLRFRNQQIFPDANRSPSTTAVIINQAQEACLCQGIDEQHFEHLPSPTSLQSCPPNPVSHD